MSIPRFYYPELGSLFPHAPLLPLPPHVAAHALKVLRLQAGDAVVLFDGSGKEYHGKLVRSDPTQASRPKRGDRIERDPPAGGLQMHVESCREISRESPLDIRLIQALQTGDKMDFTLQKAVELGVTEVQPVLSRRSVLKLSGERLERRMEHWQQVMISACEQCGRNRIPTLQPLLPLDTWLAQSSGADRMRLLLSPAAEITLSGMNKPPAVDLLIGAEGGLDPAETEAARHVGFIGLRLGPRVLRTETAGLAAVSVLQALWGDVK